MKAEYVKVTAETTAYHLSDLQIGGECKQCFVSCAEAHDLLSSGGGKRGSYNFLTEMRN